MPYKKSIIFYLINLIAYVTFKYVYVIIFFLSGYMSNNPYTMIQDLPRLLIHTIILLVIAWQKKKYRLDALIATIALTVVYFLDYYGFLGSVLTPF